jgi:hypothetical protein
MNTFTRQVNSIKTIYDNPSIIASIVDKNGEILYLSKTMQSLATIKPTHLTNITNNKTLKTLNSQVIQDQITIKYLYIMQTGHKNFTIFSCGKYPIYERNNNNSVAILTIQEPVKLFGLDIKRPIENLPNLSRIGQTILFCASLGLSHGEIYQFITKHYDETMKFKQYKSYCNDLLKIFLSNTLHELVNNNDILQYCSSIIPELLQDGLVLLRSY